MATRSRLDSVLVDRGLFETRSRAAAAVIAGDVRLGGDGLRADKPGQMVAADVEVAVAEGPRYVSRGGVKLANALDELGIDPSGRECLDIGASTGGFTDCLLQRGASRVYAVDVGTTQLDWKIRTDPRVVVKDHTNARHLTPADIGEPCSLIVCDVSFISVTLIVPVLPPLLTPDGEMIILIKPQFEVGRHEVGKGGIVRDPELHAAACRKVQDAIEGLGFRTALMDSPIEGAEGNREFLLHGRR